MTIETAADDADALRALLLAERQKTAALETGNAAKDRRIAQLEQVIKALQRREFGRRSERLDDDQLSLALDELAQELSEVRTQEDADAAHAGLRRAPQPPRKINRGALPQQLPREEVVIDLESKACPCCGGELHCIGEDRSEQLDVVPAQLRVLVTVRPRYACRACEDTVAQAPAPARLVQGGLPTDALVAQVAVSKYADHLPLYRQVQIFARQGIALDRSTLADWMGIAAFGLRPLHQRMLALLREGPRLFADETTAPVLDPGRGRTKTGKFWVYARDARPWGGSDPPCAVYVYAPDRKAVRPAAHLAGFEGTLQVDGYSAYPAMAGSKVTLAFCWAHVRRNFYEQHAAGTSPVATEALRRIAELYAVEADIHGLPPEQRCAIRQARSQPLLETMKPWLEKTAESLSSGAPLAKTIRYALGRWSGLAVYLDDGCVEIDNNAVERAMRPIALGRKNHLFAGSDGGAEHWAIWATLIETCKLNAVDPLAYLGWLFGKLAVPRRLSDIDQLLPWAYKKQSAA